MLEGKGRNQQRENKFKEILDDKRAVIGLIETIELEKGRLKHGSCEQSSPRENTKSFEVEVSRYKILPVG